MNENIVERFSSEFENSTYLHIFGEVIVHVQVYGSEVSRIIELEGNFNGATEHAWRVVSPTDPFVSWNGQEKEMEKKFVVVEQRNNETKIRFEKNQKKKKKKLEQESLQYKSGLKMIYETARKLGDDSMLKR